MAGRYSLYVRWTAHPNRASNAPYSVHHAGGVDTVSLNQQVNGGEWVLLGDFELAPAQGHRVELTNQANGRVVADAVKFVPAPGRAPVADAIKLVATAGPGADFGATASTLLREYVTLGGRPLALIEGGQVLTVHPDHLGTPQKMTDSGGALVWDAQYRPFGEAHAIAGTASNEQRFPGQLHDAETSFHYNYFRDYDPSIGRYVQSDPIGLEGGINTYTYVGSNPAMRIDLFGLKAMCKEVFSLTLRDFSEQETGREKLHEEKWNLLVDHQHPLSLLITCTAQKFTYYKIDYILMGTKLSVGYCQTCNGGKDWYVSSDRVQIHKRSANEWENEIRRKDFSGYANPLGCQLWIRQLNGG